MNDRSGIYILIVITCLIGLAHPFYAFTDYGRPDYRITIQDTAFDPPEDATVAYASLPENAQDLVDAACSDEYSTATSYLPDTAADVLYSGQYVRTSETTYRYRFEQEPAYGGLLLILRDLLSGLAGATLAVTLRRWSRGGRSGRMLSTGLTALGGAALALYSVQTHDALLTPALVPLWPPTRGMLSFVVITIALVLLCGIRWTQHHVGAGT